jgi:hypothetical protein
MEHFSIVARLWLNQWLPGRWIGRRRQVEWPPRSPDLTSLDFSFWDHLKSVMYGNRPQSIAELQDNIRAECAAITPETLWRVLSCLRRYVHMCQQQHRHQFQHLHWCKVAKNLLNYLMLERFMASIAISILLCVILLTFATVGHTAPLFLYEGMKT